MYYQQDFKLPQMEGLSEKQIEVHLGLYGGYVKNANAILDELKNLDMNPEKNALAINELTRRFPFEWDGMRMHEYYFEALGGNGKKDGQVVRGIEKEFTSFENWLNIFKKIGKFRGIGWAVLARDKKTGNLLNIWVNDHEIGHLAGTDIILAMDVWEHAYLIDYLPSQRGDYIDAFFNNLKWEVVDSRYKN